MDDVAPGIHRIGTWGVNAYLVEGDDGLAIVDTLFPGRAGRLLEGVKSLGRSPSDVRDIIATHYHLDHAGSVARLRAATGARVHIHPLDAAPLRDGTIPRSGRPSGRIASLGSRWFAGRPLEASPIHDDLVDGSELPLGGGLRVIHTPGHTAGHVSLLSPLAGGVLITGDAAVGGYLRPGVGRPWMAEDWDAWVASLRRLAELDFDIAVFGHGRVLRGRANVAFRRFVERLAR